MTVMHKLRITAQIPIAGTSEDLAESPFADFLEGLAPRLEELGAKEDDPNAPRSDLAQSLEALTAQLMAALNDRGALADEEKNFEHDSMAVLDVLIPFLPEEGQGMILNKGVKFHGRGSFVCLLQPLWVAEGGYWLTRARNYVTREQISEANPPWATYDAHDELPAFGGFGVIIEPD